MYNCVAIDDDKLFLGLLDAYFEEIDSAKLMAVFDNPVKGALGVVQMEPDVLLLDYQMPYLDGFEMLTMIRRKPKVVIISGHLEKPEDLSFPADRFVSKRDLKEPHQLEEIISEVMESD